MNNKTKILHKTALTIALLFSSTAGFAAGARQNSKTLDTTPSQTVPVSTNQNPSKLSKSFDTAAQPPVTSQTNTNATQDVTDLFANKNYEGKLDQKDAIIAD